MRQSSKLKKYSELFKRNISAFLAPGVSLKTNIYPVESNGAVFEFYLNRDNDDTEVINKTKPSVGKVLQNIPQRMFGGNLENVTFKGTSLYLEGNRVIVIKGDDNKDDWTGEAVKNDVKRVVSTSQGSRE
ncbi:hypothetical protein ACET6U_04350 [Aeromonas rivipollensis]